MSVVILNGDCRDILPTLPADSFDCIVTSPPYWGLRDYGVEGQIGLEPTIQGYLDAMVGVCRELRRVLKPEGTFWLNVGDSYAAQGGPQAKQTKWQIDGASNTQNSGNSRRPANGLKPKDLAMIPNRLAIMLQEDGWYVRSEIIWHKPNPMPESVRDRPTCAHEKVWLLTKSGKYFYDADAISEPAIRVGDKPGGNKKVDASRHDAGRDMQKPVAEMRNARNIWTIAPKPFKGAHFAVMPPDLAERCIKAGCPVGGTVLDPFGGAGTTGLAADRLGRHATLIELNPAYRDLAASRVQEDAPLFAEMSA